MTQNPKTTACRACGARIMFLKTAAGKTMPVDEEGTFFLEVKDGPELFVLGDGVTMRGQRVSPAQLMDADRFGYISHFATCTNPDFFRKPRKKDRKNIKEENEP